MSKCISNHGEFSEHEVTEGVCEFCGAVALDYDEMRAALEQIQEMHPIEETGVEGHGVKEVWCPTCREHAPCETRKLADEASGGGTNGI